MTITDKIITNPLFKGLSASDVEALLGSIHSFSRKYKEGNLIVFRDEVCENLMILYQGTAVAEMINNMGKHIIIEKMAPPKLLAPAFLYASQNRYPVDVVAQEDCQTLVIPRDELTRIMQKNEKLLFNFLEIISAQTVFLSNRVKLYGLNSLKGKIAHFILSQSTASQKTFKMPFTQQELADIFGVARPSLSRVLSEMVQEELICMDNKTIQILNYSALAKLAE